MTTTVREWQQAWRRHDLQDSKYANGTGKQTVAAAAVKNVLMHLSTWADYDHGTDAHPGAAALATATGLSANVVRWALQVGCRLGWVERTAHYPGKPLADEYALRVPDECGCGCTEVTSHSESTDRPHSVREVTSHSEAGDLTPSSRTIPDHHSSTIPSACDPVWFLNDSKRREGWGWYADLQDDDLDADTMAERVEAQDPDCFTEAWQQVVDQLPADERTEYLSDRTMTGPELADWHALHLMVCARALTLYDQAHPWQEAAA